MSNSKVRKALDMEETKLPKKQKKEKQVKGWKTCHCCTNRLTEKELQDETECDGCYSCNFCEDCADDMTECERCSLYFCASCRESSSSWNSKLDICIDCTNCDYCPNEKKPVLDVVDIWKENYLKCMKVVACNSDRDDCSNLVCKRHGRYPICPVSCENAYVNGMHCVDCFLDRSCTAKCMKCESYGCSALFHAVVSATASSDNKEKDRKFLCTDCKTANTNECNMYQQTLYGTKMAGNPTPTVLCDAIVSFLRIKTVPNLSCIE